MPTESRLPRELAHADGLTATDLSRTLELDAGCLSRLLTGLTVRGNIKRMRSADDARQQHLALTAPGQRADVGALLATLGEPQERQLLASMTTIEQLLAEPTARAAPFTLRPQRPGDIGWVVSRHGALYADEYGWEIGFEPIVARIAADFVERFDAQREACWIAERDEERIGSILLVQARDESTQAPLDGTAQLRLLLIDPGARSLGLGKRLVDECTQFALAAGYRRIVLWTNANLLAARGIYARAGYGLTHSEPHCSFGHDLVGEIRELAL